MRYLTIAAGLISTAFLASACNGSESTPPGATLPGASGPGSSGPGSSGPGSPGSGGTVSSPPRGPATPGGPPTAQGCNAEAAQFVVGQRSSQALAENARQAAGARMVRTLRPGQMVTQEYNAERLNLTVDDNGIITRVSCG